ncbi:hypothetical protein GJ496_004508 [Pomphorhynchus laevis]|nr:hypothetical protein GJ496_004508 [Pomphorhynchus laevis]
MGNKKTHPPSEFEITTLAKQTGLDAFTVRGLSTEFAANSKNGLMNKRQFQKIYSTLTPGEDPESSCKLKRLSNRVFKAFDKDNSGTLSFDEFVAAYYMLKTQG